ncbi:MAG TPA: lysine--tRNA ligase [Thermoleophilia bacterium]|nr:lysine--tRNA ligase [Thermoleophilia bacterium]
MADEEQPLGTADERRRKLARLRERGDDAFPTRFEDRDEIATLHERFDSLEAGAEAPGTFRVAGRVMSRREHGKLAFFTIKDGSGHLQLFATLDGLGAEAYEHLLEVDLGDFVGAEGAVLKTRRGELSLRPASWQFLSKALRPLPEKFHGLTDVEQRYRRRYLDTIVNDDSREVFVKRARIISAIRRFLDDRGFIEVETPILQPLYGGAMARPFVTHHNELKRDLYLRIAVELYLKRCIIGGIDRVYEIGRDFRNEGVSFKHNPEFTMLETYEAYVDYNHVMTMVEELVGAAAEAVGSLTTNFRGHEIDLRPPWPRVTMRQAILDASGIDIAADDTRDVAGLQAAVKAHGLEGTVPLEPTWGQQVDELFSVTVEPDLIQPVFITEYPLEISPFAKKTPHDPRFVERFEGFIGGMESSNAFSELNDADDQRERFLSQLVAFDAGDEEAHQLDEEFLEAMEHGMPPTGGMGMGIDRLIMVLTDSASIRDVILFPALRGSTP